MKAKEREIYITLTELCGAQPCLACKYADWQGCGSICDGGEGYYECNHPIVKLSWMNEHEEDIWPGTDCYGFRPKIELHTLIELTATILENNIEEWQVNLSRNSFELDTIQYGESQQENKYIRYRYNMDKTIVYSLKE